MKDTDGPSAVGQNQDEEEGKGTTHLAECLFPP